MTTKRNLSPSLATLLAALSLSAATPFLVANDNFADAAVIPAGGGSVGPVSNAAATVETDEPDHAGVGGAFHSLWWKWTPTAGGNVKIDTFGSDFDTVLGVYTGSAVDSLTEEESNDDYSGVQSAVTFLAIAGETYYIAVDGFRDSDTGNVSVNVITYGAVVNDDFSDAAVIAAGGGSVTGITVGATSETGEPTHAGLGPSASAWWIWTPSKNGTATIETTGSDFHTVLAVYKGSAVDALSEVASNEEIILGDPSKVTFSAVAGVTYRIAVDGSDGFEGQEGNVVLKVTLKKPALVDTWSASYNLAFYYYGAYASYGYYDYAAAYYYYYYGLGDYYYHLARKNQGLADYALYNGLGLFYLYLYGASEAGYSAYYYYLALAYYYYYVGIGDYNTGAAYYYAFIALV